MSIEHDGDPTSQSVVRRMTAAEALAMRGTGWEGDTEEIDLDIARRKDLPRETDL